MVRPGRGRSGREMHRPKKQEKSGEEAFDSSHKDGELGTAGLQLGRGKAVRVPSGVLYSERKNVNREWLCSLFAGSDASLVVSHEQNAVASTCILKETLPPHLDLRGAQVGALS